MINSFVHIIMYTYYGLSALNSQRINRYLWWKKYLTMIQLVIEVVQLEEISNKLHLLSFQVQFIVALVMGVNGIRIGCDFPTWMHYALVFYMVSFLFLFGNFYIHAYIVSERKRRQGLRNGLSTKKHED